MSLNPAMALLLERRSCHKLNAPAPEGEQLAQILRAALRAPDFRGLRPYRFLAARDEGLDRLGAALHRAAVASGRPAAEIERAPHMPHRAPLVIVVISSPKSDPLVPLFEQQLCAGCTLLSMQLAARALGFGGVWRSGWPMRDRGFQREIGLCEGETIVGFLYLGTPAQAEKGEPDRGDPDQFLAWL